MWSRALAGVFPGFLLSAGIVGLASWAWPGPWQATLVPAAIAIYPVWIGVIVGAFQFRSARRAWAWLGGLAAATLGMLWLLQSLHWIA